MISQAFEQLLHGEATHWAGALFACLRLPTGAATAPSLAAHVDDPTARLLHRLGAADGPCTLLIRGRRLVARVELGCSRGSAESSSIAESNACDPAAVLAAARYAAHQLHTAVAAAMLQSSVHVVEAHQQRRA